MNAVDPSYGSLVRDIQSGQDVEGSYHSLFKRYYGRVFGYFRRKGVSPEEAHELTQEVFLSVFKSIDRLHDPERFEGWLYSIAANRFKNMVEYWHAQRREGHEISLEEPVAEGVRMADTLDGEGRAGSPADPLKELIDEEAMGLLRNAMDGLPPQRRRCVRLKVVDELPIRVIAEQMGIAPNTVKAHLHQARQALKTALNPHFGDIGELMEDDDRAS